MHVVTREGEVHVGAQAIRFVYQSLGYSSAAVLGWPGVRALAGVGYRFMANHRIAASKVFFRTPEDEA